MNIGRPVIYNILIAILAFLLFVPFIGGVHLFDWDEINFAESAREMIVTGDYLTVRINFLPFWEKPPLFIWMQALSLKIFGINEFAARLPNAVCGIITLLVLFNIGRKLFDINFGLIWIITYAFSVLPFLYFKSGIIDPWFNLFIFLGIHQFIIYQHKKSKLPVALSAIFVGLGILTKGPVALLIFMLTAGIFWMVGRFRKIITLKHSLIFITALIFTGGFWFILQLANGNFSILKDFIEYQVRLFKTEDAGHGGFFLYHFVVLLIGVFPASLFAFQGFVSSASFTDRQKVYGRWMIILFFVVLVLFTVVKTKIVHYSSMCYFPLTFLSARFIYNISVKKATMSKWTVYGVLFIGILIALAVAVIPLLGMLNHKFVSYFYRIDDFTRSILMADIHWSGFEPFVMFVLVLGLILFVVFFKRKNFSRAIIVLFIATGITAYLTLLTYITKIEQYSQGAAIEFFKELKNKDAYVTTIGYKSYAQLFYTCKSKPENQLSYDREWLLTGEIDKDAYFSCKVTSRDAILKIYPEVKVLYEKNGYVFMKRDKKF